MCGRKGGCSNNMKGLCRDCDMKPSDGDDTCIGEDLLFKFHNLGNVAGKTKEQLDEYSFLPINNCFHNISLGGCGRKIYGAPPTEILHAVLLGICKYIAECMEMTCSTSATDLICDVSVGIYEHSQRKSERDLPDLGPFQYGLMSIKELKAKERFSQSYCVFLSLSILYLIQGLCTKKRKTGE